MNITNKQQKIGELIAKIRQEKNLTQKDLAHALNTSQSAIARIEKGEQNISTKMLTKISNILQKDIITLASPAINIKIKGNKKLHGTITTNTSKNSAVALLCASLLNKNKTVLKNVPEIEEVKRLVEVLNSIRVSVKKNGHDLEIIPPKEINLDNLNEESGKKTRSIIMFIGPLIHFFKEFKIPQAGGCKLGERTTRPHFFALEKFGVKYKKQDNHYLIRHKQLHPAEIVLYEAGDTVTANALMAAARISGKTVIEFASSNYQVQDLCHFLVELGVKIKGIGTHKLIVEGLEEINKPVEYYLSEDPIESQLFLAIAATTKSSITIKRCPIDFLKLELLKLEKMGLKFNISKPYKSYNNKTNLVDITTYPSNLHALKDKIHPLPYPGINIDNLPFFVPIATQAKGTTLIHDWIYENRAIYYTEMNKLGADIILADPHRVYINGPTPLTANEIICPPALRPAAIILIGMLAAEGTSILRNIYSINRGYEDIVNRLKTLGAQIDILREF